MGEVITPQEVRQAPAPKAKWHYYLNKNNKVRWKCSNCGKVLHKYPRDEYYCGRCGAEMSMES